MKLERTGDWNGYRNKLEFIENNLRPALEAQFIEDSEYAASVIKGHIDKQDLNWKPLSEQTIALKGGNSTIYVNTGFLYDNIQSLQVKGDDFTVFIGIDSGINHPESGRPLTDIMLWLEYGTDEQVARPLIQPSWAEIEPVVKEHWKELMKMLVSNTGGKLSWRTVKVSGMTK